MEHGQGGAQAQHDHRDRVLPDDALGQLLPDAGPSPSAAAGLSAGRSRIFRAHFSSLRFPRPSARSRLTAREEMVAALMASMAPCGASFFSFSCSADLPANWERKGAAVILAPSPGVSVWAAPAPRSPSSPRPPRRPGRWARRSRGRWWPPRCPPPVPPTSASHSCPGTFSLKLAGLREDRLQRLLLLQPGLLGDLVLGGPVHEGQGAGGHPADEEHDHDRLAGSPSSRALLLSRPPRAPKRRGSSERSMSGVRQFMNRMA